MEISRNERESQHRLKLDKGIRDALADYWRDRWPSNTAKLGAREYGLTLDEARGVVAGRASLTTIERIIKNENGGWALIIAVMAHVTGQHVEHYLIEKRKSHEDRAERLGALVGDWGTMRPSRRDDPGDLREPLAERRRFDRRRMGEG